MKLQNIAPIVSLLLTLSGCQVQTDSGAIPLEYLQVAKQYEGKYVGDVKLMHYRKESGRVLSSQMLDKLNDKEFTITFDGIKPKIESNFDLTMKEECHSSIKNLKSISANRITNDVAIFEFNRGECVNSIQDNEVTFWIGHTLKGEERIMFEIVKYSKPTGTPQRYIEVIIKGNFKKID